MAFLSLCQQTEHMDTKSLDIPTGEMLNSIAIGLGILLVIITSIPKDPQV